MSRDRKTKDEVEPDKFIESTWKALGLASLTIAVAFAVLGSSKGGNVVECTKFFQPTQFCTYDGWGILPSSKRNKCMSVKAGEAVCERVSAAQISEQFKYADILKNPTGTYGMGRSRKGHNSRLIIVNYKTKEALGAARWPPRSDEELSSLQADFKLFLKDPKRHKHQIVDAPLEWAWISNIALLGPMLILSLVCFQESKRYSDRPKPKV